MWLIRTKLDVPPPTERLIARQRLRRRLPAILRARVALVHAPAGFGKTCLLAEWRRCLSAQRVRTAWLSLDEDDSEPMQFLAYVTASLGTAGIDMGSLGPAAERGFPDVPVGSLIAAIDQCLRRAGGHTVVLLDDYHRLRGQAVQRALAALIRAVGSRVTFVIAARELPALLAEDVALRASCVEVASDELRFGIDEARSLLERTAAPVAAPDVDAIVAGTDGWAIAIAAVRDWLRNGWSMERVRASLARPTTDLVRNVTEHILASLSAPEHEFLLRTAIVDRFSPQLAHALAGDLPTSEIIAALERKDLVVAMCDASSNWYRCHRLLTDLALRRLEASRPHLVCELHRRAAAWFFDAALHTDAVRHALASGDPRLLAGMFENAGGWQLAIAGYVGLARNALTLLAPEVLREYPRAQLARVLLLAKLGQVHEARDEMERFRSMHLGSADVTLAGEAALLEACLERYEDRPVTAESIVAFERISGGFAPGADVLHATHANILTTLHYERGDLDAALEAAQVATLRYRAMRSVFGEVFVYVHQGSALLERGRLRDAIETLRQAWQLARDTTGPNTETEAVAATMLATALHAHGELDEARRLLDSAQAAIESRESWYDVLAAGYSTVLRIALFEADFAAARAVVDRARTTAARRGMRRLHWLADVLAVHVAAAQRRSASTEDAERIAASLRSALGAFDSPRLANDARLALAALDLARGYPAVARDVARDVAAAASGDRAQRALLEARFIEARALLALGDRADAQAAFESAVALAMHEGWLQPFVEAGAVVRELLPPPDSYRHSPRVRDRFLRDVDAATRIAMPAQRSLGLSERERAIASLLGKDLSNKAIGRAMHVSDNTVKFHLKNIYAKLGVASRREAAEVLAGNRVPPYHRGASATSVT